MRSVFLSYSSQDYFFAEMLALKLDEKGFKIWRDMGAIRAGDDWRQSIEDGIRDCFAVVVALSESSATSPYVTYEWACAIGMRKPVIPVKLTDCDVHPRLEPTQHIDFSYPKALPWNSLIDRLNEIEVEIQPKTKKSTSPPPGQAAKLDELADEILAYLNDRGYTMASFKRLKQNMDSSPDDEMFNAVIQTKPALFRRARIKGGKPGIAKRMP